MATNFSIVLIDEIIFVDGKRNSELSELRPSFKIILGLIVAASLIWGSLGKVLIYKNCMKIKLSERPINLKIWTDEIIYHSIISFRYIFITLYVVETHTIQHL